MKINAASIVDQLLLGQFVSRNTVLLLAQELQAHQATYDELVSLLPSTDQPDGGSVTVLEQLQRMAKDAERYRTLSSLKCNSFSVSKNDAHAMNYTTAAKWIDEVKPEDFEDVDPGDLQLMRSTNTIWQLQIYPSTPIGSYSWYGPTLDCVVDASK